MAKKRPNDINIIASQIIPEVPQERKEKPTNTQTLANEKTPAATALARLRGLKGIPAREKRLSSKNGKRLLREPREQDGAKINNLYLPLINKKYLMKTQAYK
jgi:hypothetical protein